MEILFEALLEIFGEVICAAVGTAFCSLSDKYMISTKTRRLVRLIIGTLILIGVIAVTIYGLVIKKGPLIIASLLYILSIIIVRGVLFFNGKNGKKWIDRLFRWIARILHYGFAVTIIVLAAIFVNKPVAKPVIICLSVLAIIILAFIDAHRYRVWKKQKVEENKIHASDDNDDIFSQYDNENKLED